VLGALTLSAMLLVLGLAAAVDAADAADLHSRDYLALAVGTLGVGLLVGAWYGRARGLTWLGIPLVLTLLVFGSSELSLEGGAGERRYAPQELSELEDTYRVGVGNLQLDLSALDFSERSTTIVANAGVGNVEVLVPRDADVRVEGRSGVGEVELFDQKQNGTSSRRLVTDLSPTGDGTIDLVLDLDVNIGKVEVNRAQA
jgi:hypothetical protein